jgi:hypothetical protein
MESNYIEFMLNHKQLKINKNDSMDFYIWKIYKNASNKWFPLHPSLHINKESGYERYVIYINNKQYPLSRVVYQAHNSDWDISKNTRTHICDHINNDSRDNRIENLRIITQQQNSYNTKKSRGYTYLWREDKYRACIRAGKVFKYKDFDTPEEASAQYYEWKALLHKIE